MFCRYIHLRHGIGLIANSVFNFSDCNLDSKLSIDFYVLSIHLNRHRNNQLKHKKIIIRYLKIQCFHKTTYGNTNIL